MGIQGRPQRLDMIVHRRAPEHQQPRRNSDEPASVDQMGDVVSVESDLGELSPSDEPLLDGGQNGDLRMHSIHNHASADAAPRGPLPRWAVQPTIGLASPV